MDKVIDVDFRVTWHSPISVRIGNDMRERIGGPDTAFAALPHRWPSSGRSEYASAERRCVNAIARQGSPELARDAFVEAASAAKVLA
jgi:hypothetical protein